jgi:hypothetical protein
MILNLATKIDFGAMKFGQSYTKNYEIKNTSSSAITVTDLGRSCSCTEVSLDKTVIKPNESVYVKVTVTPGSTGLFSRSFWFKINGQSYTVSLSGHAS